MNAIIITAISIIGSILCVALGSILGYYYFRKQEQDKFNMSLYVEYQKLSQELADLLHIFLPLTLRPTHYTEKMCTETDTALSAFMFRNYLTLPQTVLEEINCMHACLQTKGAKIFIVDRSKPIPLIRQCVGEKETISFFREVTIFRTKTNLAEIYMKYKRVPNYLALRCQARHLIATMQDCWQYTDMHSWKEQMQKKTLAKLDIID